MVKGEIKPRFSTIVAYGSTGVNGFTCFVLLFFTQKIIQNRTTEACFFGILECEALFAD